MRRGSTEEMEGLPRPHLVCFACRKAFKPALGIEPTEEASRPVGCPDCGGPMARLGRYFEAPPRHAVRHWLKVELLFALGETFDTARVSRGHRGSFDSLRDAIEYLVRQRHIPEEEVRGKLEQLRRARRPAAPPASRSGAAERSPRRPRRRGS